MSEHVLSLTRCTYSHKRTGTWWEGEDGTLRDATAVWSFSTLRATRMIFAPLAASFWAAARPIPSEPPVMRTVYIVSNFSILCSSM